MPNISADMKICNLFVCRFTINWNSSGFLTLV